MSSPAAARATPEGTAEAARKRAGAPGAYRMHGGLTLSSIGLGSYLGEVGPAANRAYEEAALEALQGGVNVLDTAANYRDQQSERDLGRALRRYGDREAVLVATKAGFLHGDAAASDPQAWFRRTYVDTGVLGQSDVVGSHAMNPEYLRVELEQSLRNLGLGAVDVFFLHNPEHPLASGMPRAEHDRRLALAFHELESQCMAGRVGLYGVATWTGLRVGPGRPEHLGLERLLDLAKDAARRAGADRCHFGAVELPFNLAMPEAAAAPTQPWRGSLVPPLVAARDAGLIVFASASLMQAQLLGRVPEDVRIALGAPDDLTAAIEFARGAPGVTTALVGMGRADHARQNATLLDRAPDPVAVARLLEQHAG